MRVGVEKWSGRERGGEGDGRCERERQPWQQPCGVGDSVAAEAEEDDSLVGMA